MNTLKKTYIAFTADVDPDVNVPVETQIDAVSHPPEEGKVRFETCGKGLRLVTELLQKLEIEATFFFEARTAEVLNDKLKLEQFMRPHEVGCHSWRHEDFTASSSQKLTKPQKHEIITNSLTSLKTIFPNHNIIGFRAPYLKIDIELATVLEELGFKYDSSATFKWDLSTQKKAIFFRPRTLKGTHKRLLELPLPLWADDINRASSSYLWPFLESEKVLEDYFGYISQSTELPNDEIIILGTHPWHIVETYNRGILQDNEISKTLAQITTFLIDLQALPNTEFIRLDEYLKKVDTVPIALDLEKQWVG